MEKPLNTRQRNNAIGRFLFICLVVAGLIFYHVMISLDFFNSYSTMADETPTEIPVSGE
jgi:hypothetical protein